MHIAPATIVLAKDAESSAFAQMLSELLRQNLEGKPHKRKDLDALEGSVALVADDAQVAITMDFQRGSVVFHEGIRGVPDVTVRGTSDAIMALSNFPLSRRLGVPLPITQGSYEALRSMVRATVRGELTVHGLLSNPGLVARLTRVMSVNG